MVSRTHDQKPLNVAFYTVSTDKDLTFPQFCREIICFLGFLYFYILPPPTPVNSLLF